MIGCDKPGCNKEAIAGFEEAFSDTPVIVGTYWCALHKGDMRRTLQGKKNGQPVSLFYFVVKYGSTARIEHLTDVMMGRRHTKGTEWFDVAQKTRADAEALLASLRAKGAVD
jgi:hypothetical protein